MPIYTAFGVNGNGGTGPASSLVLGAAWCAGLLFKVTKPGYQLSGYGQWRADANQATSAPFALWQATGAGTGTLVSNSTATVTGMTIGTWTYVSLATPVQLTSGTTYKAVVAFTSDAGPWQQNMFGTGQTYAAGVTNGPLTMFSSGSGSNVDPYGDNQGTYIQNQSDPTVAYPTSIFADSNPWLDVQITPTAPPGLTVLQAVKRAAFY